jgi:hypothetical protein
MVDVFSRGSVITNNILINSTSEMLSFGGMLSEIEKTKIKNS